MIKIGEVYYDTVLETLFIVDAVSSTRVYLLELKEKVDPRVVIEKPGTIRLRYMLTNIGSDIVANEINLTVPHVSIEPITSIDSNGKIVIEGLDSVKDITPKKIKAKLGRRIVKKVTKKLIKNPNKK